MEATGQEQETEVVTGQSGNTEGKRRNKSAVREKTHIRFASVSLQHKTKRIYI